MRPSVTTSPTSDLAKYCVHSMYCCICRAFMSLCSVQPAGVVPALGTESIRRAFCHSTPARTLSVVCFSKPTCCISQHSCRPCNKLALALCHCGLAQSLCDWHHAGTGPGAPKGHYRTSPAGKMYAEAPGDILPLPKANCKRLDLSKHCRWDLLYRLLLYSSTCFAL